MDTERRRYRAFISYSQRDKRIARALHRSLETYRVPDGVAAEVDAHRRLGRFFRDDEEMGASQSLGRALEDALDDSESLIVVCSPAAAQSKWVDAEVRRFKRRGGARIFAVIAEGEPHAADPARECFPPALKVRIDQDGNPTEEPDEPRAPDLRREGMSRVRAQLAAGLLNVPFDDLWRRDRRRALKTSRMITAGTAVLVVLTVIGAVYAYTRAQELEVARGNALGERARSMANPPNDSVIPIVAALAVQGWGRARSSEGWSAVQSLPVSDVASLNIAPGSVRQISFRPGSEEILVSTEGGIVSVVDVTTNSSKARRAFDQDSYGAGAIASDGDMWATARVDGALRVFSLKSHRELARFGRAVLDTDMLKFSPDGSVLAWSEGERDVHLTSTRTWQHAMKIVHAEAKDTSVSQGVRVNAICFSGDGQFFASGGYDGVVNVVDVRRMKIHSQFKLDAPVYRLTANGNGTLFAAAVGENSVRILDVTTGTASSRFSGQFATWSLAFSPDSTRLAIGSADGTLRIVELESGQISTRVAHSRGISILRFDRYGRFLASGSGDGIVWLNDGASARARLRIDHEGPISAIEFDSTGRLLATGNVDSPPAKKVEAKLIRLMPDPSTVRAVPKVNELLIASDGKVALGREGFSAIGHLFDFETGAPLEFDGSVRDAFVSPGGKIVATLGGHEESAAALVELPGGNRIAEISPLTFYDAFSFSNDGKLIAVARGGHELDLVDAADHSKRWSIRVDPAVEEIQFSGDSRVLVLTLADESIRIVEVASGQLVGDVKNVGPDWPLLSPDGMRMLVGKSNIVPRLIDLASARQIAELRHDGVVLASKFSRDGHYLATGSRDNSARVFDSATGDESVRVRHEAFVVGVAFDNDGRHLASVSSDQRAIVTEIENPQTVLEIAVTHLHKVSMVAFSPDGSTLITGDTTELRYWSLDRQEPFRALCRNGGRNLSMVEWKRHFGLSEWKPTCDCWPTPSDVPSELSRSAIQASKCAPVVSKSAPKG